MQHTHAIALLMDKVPVKVISKRLGHSSTEITQEIYSHITPKMQEQAANSMDKLFNTERSLYRKCKEILSVEFNFCPNCGKKGPIKQQVKAE